MPPLPSWKVKLVQLVQAASRKTHTLQAHIHIHTRIIKAQPVARGKLTGLLL